MNIEEYKKAIFLLESDYDLDGNEEIIFYEALRKAVKLIDEFEADNEDTNQQKST